MTAQLSPLRVTPDERDLLIVARAVTGHEPFAFVEGLLASGAPARAPGPTAMGALKRNLATGAMWMLARGGGAEDRPRLSGGEIVRGRAWDVSPSLELAFSPYTFELLRWVRCEPLADAPSPFVAKPTAVGDELVCVGLLTLTRGTSLEGVIASQPGVRASALAWLSHADALALASWSEPVTSDGGAPAEAEAPAALTAASAARLFDGDYGVVLGCLENDLVRAWTAAPGVPACAVTSPLAAAHVGRARLEVLEAFASAARSREELIRSSFIVAAAARVVGRDASPSVVAAALLRPLSGGGPLRDRSLARRHAGAILRAASALDRDREALGNVRFFEEGYAVAQATLDAWDLLGKDGFSRVTQVVRAIDALSAPRGEESE